MGDTESRGSRVCNSWWNQSGRKQKQKVEVYGEVLSRLKGLNVKEASVPGFDDELWAHFYYLPTRYALDMNVERAQDVLMHKRLLHMARFPTIATGPAIEVRLVQISREALLVHALCSFHPPPAFASSANLELDLCKNQLQAEDKSNNFNFYAHDASNSCRPVHEITISTNDKPKLLSQVVLFTPANTIHQSF
ncbi:hypothetical protein Ahy_A08g037712 isoform A [Arachis hypogaea]|uniref:Uncharacterized protein n=1 Tax=Arachis hypogaea TaxID=3818 RepID=A0A445BRP3_ARAHY|nr:hypothetical protein Ahy_A08g037712 isoform A [Arachis hypogaea]